MGKGGKSHSKKISVDLRGFHIFDDPKNESDEEDGASKKKKAREALKERIKHAQKMSVDLGGYHLFDDPDNESEEEDEVEDGGFSGPNKCGTKTGGKKMHDRKISVDLRGFDLFEDSDSEDEDSSSGGPGKVITDKDAISASANDNFRRAQMLYLSKDNEEDEDLKGFHLFDEYNSDDSDEDVVKLHEMEQGQLAVLVRQLLVENAILKDASSRARSKLDSRKETIKAMETNKLQLVKAMATEMNNMRDIIRSLSMSGGSGSTRSKTIS